MPLKTVKLTGWCSSIISNTISLWPITAAYQSLRGEEGTHPLVVDLFAGGGVIPLEALRVGAEAFATDLNPLAVQASRVNFLIAIADLVAAAKIEVELPILLADAVYSPAHTPRGSDDLVKYNIGSAYADLR